MIKIIFNLFIALILVNNILYSENKIEKGEESFNLNKYKEAIVLYQSIISNKEQKYIDKFGSIKELEAFCYFQIGKCYYYQKFVGPTIKNFNKVINDYAKTDYHHKALFWKAGAYYHLKKDYAKALKYFKKYSEKYKDKKLYFLSIFSVANCYTKLNELDKAIQILSDLKNAENIDEAILRQIEFKIKNLMARKEHK